MSAIIRQYVPSVSEDMNAQDLRTVVSELQHKSSHERRSNELESVARNESPLAIDPGIHSTALHTPRTQAALVASDPFAVPYSSPANSRCETAVTLAEPPFCSLVNPESHAQELVPTAPGHRECSPKEEKLEETIYLDDVGSPRKSRILGPTST
jgi:hypothetical protein